MRSDLGKKKYDGNGALIKQQGENESTLSMMELLGKVCALFFEYGTVYVKVVTK